MFDRQAALKRIQDPGWRGSIGYEVRMDDTVVSVRRVDMDNGIYRVTVVNCADTHQPIAVCTVEEMTPEQAVDRFQELLCQVGLAGVLLGWIGAT